jgi:hypothetical protein
MRRSKPRGNVAKTDGIVPGQKMVAKPLLPILRWSGVRTESSLEAWNIREPPSDHLRGLTEQPMTEVRAVGLALSVTVWWAAFADGCREPSLRDTAPSRPCRASILPSPAKACSHRLPTGTSPRPQVIAQGRAALTVWRW